MAEPVPLPSEPAPPFDGEREIAWARGRHPTELATVSFESLSPRLEAWVPEHTELTVYLLSDQHTCTKTLLSRPLRQPDEEGSDAVALDAHADPASEHLLIGRIDVQEKTKGKIRERSYYAGTFGHYFETQSAWGIEQLVAGSWVQTSSSAIGDPPEYQGTLSNIDDEVAVFGGVPVNASVQCDGPAEIWQCPSGGERFCDSCRRSRVELREVPPRTSRFEGVTLGSIPTPEPCNDRCPEKVPADRERIERLFASTPAWFPAPNLGRPPPALHRSKAHCLAEIKRRKTGRS